jgi:hypothetical protein
VLRKVDLLLSAVVFIVYLAEASILNQILGERVVRVVILYFLSFVTDSVRPF